MNKSNIKASEIKIQRCIKHKGSCVTCKKECPFLYCQHKDCMACKNRLNCPMCHGECENCEVQNFCKILRLDVGKKEKES